MQKRITDYMIAETPGESGSIDMVAVIDNCYMDLMKIGVSLPDSEKDIALAQIEALKEKYGLPVAPSTIMDHFNRELLPDVEPEKELFGMLFEAVKEAQKALSKYAEGIDMMDKHDLIDRMYGIFDNKNLVSAMREYEKQKA